MAKKKVLLGMSGGVDSSVTAAILLKQGFEVIGATFQLQEKQTSTNDAAKVAEQLGIEHLFLDLKNQFKDRVIDYFINSYLHGETPNPCTTCNRFIKFDALLNKALAMGIDYIATGHYARVEFDENKQRYLLKKSLAGGKDQSYVLYALTQAQLARVIFPLGNFTKPAIRAKAKELGLSVADKPDSQEICFIPDNNYRHFIQSQNTSKIKPGNFVDQNGKILGQHTGITNYTIGQRTGLGIALGYPIYVTKIDPVKNEVVLGTNQQLFTTTLYAKDLNFIAIKKLEEPLKIKAKIRSSALAESATIYPADNEQIKLVFDQAQRAITPGQAVVFYDDDVVIGGGKII